MSTYEKIELKNVLMGDGSQKTVTVEAIAFNRRNDDHVEFAFAYSDMLSRLPSPFRSLTEAAVRAVELFMVHKSEDEKNPSSTYYMVHADKRAARTFFNASNIQKELFDFFENA